MTLRCAYCHAEDAPLAACDACRTRVHPACRAAHGRCPTLGCHEPRCAHVDRPLAPWARRAVLWLLRY